MLQHGQHCRDSMIATAGLAGGHRACGLRRGRYQSLSQARPGDRRAAFELGCKLRPLHSCSIPVPLSVRRSDHIIYDVIRTCSSEYPDIYHQ